MLMKPGRSKTTFFVILKAFPMYIWMSSSKVSKKLELLLMYTGGFTKTMSALTFWSCVNSE